MVLELIRGCCFGCDLLLQLELQRSDGELPLIAEEEGSQVEEVKPKTVAARWLGSWRNAKEEGGKVLSC
jgi:hypothetical protein